MKLWGRMITACFLLMSAIDVAMGQTQQRVALVIGNGNYLSAAKLRNPANDARAMAAILRHAGFDVIEREDVTRRSMIQALLTFSEKLTPGGVGLFFYAGHGMQVQGANYLVPVDAAFSVLDEVKYETVDVQDVLDKLDNARVRLSLVILDACRNNPFIIAGRSIRGGLAPIDPARGTFIAYSTAPGKVAADGDENNSVYTKALLEAMSEPGRKLQDVFDRVTNTVELETKNAQTPWTYSSFLGDFYFIQPTTLTITPPSNQSSISVEAQEQAAWTAVAGSVTAAPLEAFLKQFPASVFAGIARAKIKELNATKEQAFVRVPAVQRREPAAGKSAETQEQAAWTAVAASTTAAPLEAFLRRFPSGVFTDIARAKIEELKGPAQQPLVTVVPTPQVEGSVHMPDLAGLWHTNLRNAVTIDIAMAPDGSWYSQTRQQEKLVRQMRGTYKKIPASGAAGTIVFKPADGSDKIEADKYELDDSGTRLKLGANGQSMIFEKRETH